MAAALAGAARGGFGQQICWLHCARCALPPLPLREPRGAQGKARESPGRRSVRGAIPTGRPGKQTWKGAVPRSWALVLGAGGPSWAASTAVDPGTQLHLSSIKIYPGLGPWP